MLTLAVFMIVLGLLMISLGVTVAQATPLTAGRECFLFECLGGRPAESSVNSGRVGLAKRHVGATARQLGLRRTLWCAAFMNLVERSAGRRGTRSDLADSYLRYGQAVSGPAIGAIAVMKHSRRGFGHVGVVTGVTRAGDPIVVSGNHGHRVAESVYPRSRIKAFRT